LALIAATCHVHTRHNSLTPIKWNRNKFYESTRWPIKHKYSQIFRKIAQWNLSVHDTVITGRGGAAKKFLNMCSTTTTHEPYKCINFDFTWVSLITKVFTWSFYLAAQCTTRQYKNNNKIHSVHLVINTKCYCRLIFFCTSCIHFSIYGIPGIELFKTFYINAHL